jgi:hypothetical protein
VAVPLLALALPILDAGLAVFRRFVRRRPVFQGDRDHIHHRLVDLGLTQRRAVITLYGVAVLFTSLALAVAMGPWQAAWAALALTLLAIGAGVRALGYWEVTEFQKSFLSRLVAGLRTSGDAALQGVEHDIARMDRSGRPGAPRDTAWELGLTELHLAPLPAYRADCPEFHSFAPTAQDPAAPPKDPGPPQARWTIDVDWEGEVVAEVTARRPLSRVDFDPGRVATIIQEMVRRHLDACRNAKSRL